MSRRRLSWSIRLALGIAWPCAAFALGLGDIATHSRFNQLLDAEIPLLSVKQENLPYVRVGLAPREDFDRVGVPRQQLLTALRFRPVVNERGMAVIKVSSTKPIREPFLNFLVEISHGGNRMVREYTLLLDPVAYSPRQRSVSPVPVTARSRAERRPPGAQARTRTDAYGPVKSGETVSVLGFRLRPDKGVAGAQMAWALYRANPDAFTNGDIHNLRAGARLRIPSRELALETPYPDALQMVRSGARAAEAVPAPPVPAAAGTAMAPVAQPEPEADEPEEGFRLRLLSSEEEAELSAGSAAPEATLPEVADAELPGLVAKLRADIQGLRVENERLEVRLRSAEQRMAELQSQSAERDARIRALQAAAFGQPRPEAKPATPAPHAAAPMTAPPQAEAAAGAPGSLPALPVPPAEAQKSWEWRGLSRFAREGALIVALVVLLVWLLLRRDRGLFPGARGDRPGEGAAREKDYKSKPGRSNPRGGEQRPVPPPAPWAMRDAFEQTERPRPAAAGNASRNQEDELAQTLSEADLCLAYGQYEVAETLLTELVHDHPETPEYRRRLLRVLHAAGKDGAFLEQARQLRELVGTKEADLWAEAAELGRELWPHEPLFRRRPEPAGEALEKTMVADLRPQFAEGRERRAQTDEPGTGATSTPRAIDTEHLDLDLDVFSREGQAVGDAEADPDGEREQIRPLDLGMDAAQTAAEPAEEDLSEVADELLNWDQIAPDGPSSRQDETSLADAATLERLGLRERTAEGATPDKPAGEEDPAKAVLPAWDEMTLGGYADSARDAPSKSSAEGPAPEEDQRSRGGNEETGRDTRPPVAGKDLGAVADALLRWDELQIGEEMEEKPEGSAARAKATGTADDDDPTEPNAATPPGEGEARRRED